MRYEDDDATTQSTGETLERHKIVPLKRGSHGRNNNNSNKKEHSNSDNKLARPKGSSKLQQNQL